MTVWQQTRWLWARPVPDIVALRRARARAAYHARRKPLAAERRRTLAWLLRQHGFDPPVVCE
jgi:hypothetical protein